LKLFQVFGIAHTDHVTSHMSITENCDPLWIWSLDLQKSFNF